MINLISQTLNNIRVAQPLGLQMIKIIPIIASSLLIYGCAQMSGQKVYIGVFDGYGKATLPDNSVYEGRFENDLFNGQGAITRKDGDRYEGSFKNGMAHGKGVFITSVEKRYEGEFVNGRYHGKGIVYFSNSDSC